MKREKIEGDLEDFIEKDIEEDEYYANQDSQEEDVKKLPDN